MTSALLGGATRGALLSVLVLVLCSAGVAAQDLHIQTVRGETYAFVAIECLPPLEEHKIRSTAIDSLSDGLQLYRRGCTPHASVSAQMIQEVDLSADSLYIWQGFTTNTFGELSQSAHATLSLQIQFHVGSDQRLGYEMPVRAWADIAGPFPPCPECSLLCWASVHFALSRVADGAAIDSLTVRAGPGPETEVSNEIGPVGVLGPGDYSLSCRSEAVSSSPSYSDSEHAGGGVTVCFKYRYYTTAVKSVSWEYVKSLYQ
jgi:hypothetical protein